MITADRRLPIPRSWLAPVSSHEGSDIVPDVSNLWTSLWLSLQVAIPATLLACAVGVPIAFVMARRPFPGRSIVEATLTVPLILPPTVVGYLLLLLLGSQGFFGTFLRAHFDFSIVFHISGAILASAIVALPLVYLPARSAFASVDSDLEDNARLIGANILQLFWHVSLPLARRGIAGGLLLAFGRALGEFGATVMVFGSGPRQTLPILIYEEYASSRFMAALPAVGLLTAVSFVMVVIYNRSSLGTRA